LRSFTDCNESSQPTAAREPSGTPLGVGRRGGGARSRQTQATGGPQGTMVGSATGLQTGCFGTLAAPRTRPGGHRPTAAVTRGRRTADTPRSFGEGESGNEPQGCEWLKETTGFGEAKTARVVGNDGGGPQRVWKPATRRSRRTGVRATGGRPSREVDSPDWERRRGDEPQGRRFLEEGRCLHRPGARDGDAAEVLESERKATSGITTGRETNQPAAWWKTPRSTSRGAKDEGGAGKPNERLHQAVRR
jgi:hypothetical protein